MTTNSVFCSQTWNWTQEIYQIWHHWPGQSFQVSFLFIYLLFSVLLVSILNMYIFDGRWYLEIGLRLLSQKMVLFYSHLLWLNHLKCCSHQNFLKSVRLRQWNEGAQVFNVHKFWDHLVERAIILHGLNNYVRLSLKAINHDHLFCNVNRVIHIAARIWYSNPNLIWLNISLHQFQPTLSCGLRCQWRIGAMYRSFLIFPTSTSKRDNWSPMHWLRSSWHHINQSPKVLYWKYGQNSFRWI